ncbi:MAG: L-aspartate oxidase [Planctomycetes bacterium]|nr:L-aspartate oxidase [Planctomycetota bacterium]
MFSIFDERRYLIPFRATLLPQVFTDVLVIGAGVAGMRAALAAGEHPGAEVIVTAKGDVQQSNTAWAQGGIAAVMAKDDSFESHVDDTLKAGAGLCDEPVVRQVISGGPPLINQLMEWGMRIDRVNPADPRSPIAFGREGGHSHSRILHADGDATGRELAITLERRLRAQPNIRLFTNCFSLDLITTEGSAPRCVGAITHHPKYGLQVIWAHAVILASGGAAQVYRESTNPPVATGDGLAMAYRAGARVADMAFMQFHPTTLYIAGASRSLITEAVRGEGAQLIDRNGYRFMGDYHPDRELAPRDVVSKAILDQMTKTAFSHVYLDARAIGTERFRARFPGIFELLKKFDIDPGKTPIPIHPSAHYMVGGVWTDESARTSIAGLYACGEAACTGLHGANRLASNSLLEGLVYGEIAGRTSRECLEPANGGGHGRASLPAKVISDIRPSDRSELDLADVRSSLRSVMWRHVGIERDGARLGEVMEMFEFWARYTLDKIFDDRGGWEVQNLLLVGALITREALWRRESRGTHFRIDFPQPRDEFRVHSIWQRGQKEPVPSAVREGQAAATA